jgi:heme O synthase-like polyprenyltransferase
MAEEAHEPEQKDPADELIELLTELRVVLPGVQVLFAFLLAVPFSQRFARVADVERDAYFVSLLATVVGTALLIAPSAYHRLRWRDVSDEEILRTSNRMAIAGSLALAVAMTAAVLLVTDVLFSNLTTAVVTAATAGLFTWLWFGLPIWRHYHPPRWSERYRGPQTK